MAKNQKTVEQAPVVSNQQTEEIPANVQTEPATEAKPSEPTDKRTELEKLTDELNEKFAFLIKQTPGSKEMLDANLEIYKIQQKINAEHAKAAKADADAKLVEARNARVKLADDLINALKTEMGFYYEVYKTLPEDEKTARMGEMNALSDASKNAGEIVKNELLARYATSTPAKTTVTKGTPAERGAKAKEIIEMFKANRAAGVNDTDNVKKIIEAGHSRGTTGAVVLAWQRETGEKPAK